MLKPKRLAADTAYGNARTLKNLAERGIAPHIPVMDKCAPTDGLFSRADFQYDQARDVYICPGGKQLRGSAAGVAFVRVRPPAAVSAYTLFTPERMCPAQRWRSAHITVR